jgi:hypothetical protein
VTFYFFYIALFKIRIKCDRSVLASITNTVTTLMVL